MSKQVYCAICAKEVDITNQRPWVRVCKNCAETRQEAVKIFLSLYPFLEKEMA